MASNGEPTVAGQSYASLCLVVVREVGAAVSTGPVSVTHTLQLIAAHLESRTNPE